MSEIKTIMRDGTIKTGEGVTEMVFVPSDEASICFYCDKPQCKSGSCKRYNEQMAMLKKKGGKKDVI